MNFDIVRSANFSYASADNFGLGNTPTGKLEISFFSFHNQFTRQVFKPKSVEGDIATMEAGSLSAHSVMVENVCVSVSDEGALGLAEALVRHLLSRNSITKEQAKDLFGPILAD
ncbi:MAG: hypothetical protein K2X25_07730 [Caulobacteraceae bacterium]|nr:hypothetical protein [Caulobacteraceae bacterium]